MADLVTRGLPGGDVAAWWSFLDRVPHRTGLWIGLLLGVAASIVPAASSRNPDASRCSNSASRPC